MAQIKKKKKNPPKKDGTYGTSCTQQRNERTLHHILVDADTPDRLAAPSRLALDVRGGLYTSTLANSVFLVVVNVKVDVNCLERSHHTGNRAVATAAQPVLYAVDENDALEDTDEILGFLSLARDRRHRRLRTVGRDAVVEEADSRMLAEEVSSLKQLGNLIGSQFASELLSTVLNNTGEGNLEAAREVKLQLGLEDEGTPTLAGLRVDANDGLVVAANILGIQR